ncbi:MAG: hypothetical protein LUG83_02215 [Lachnospiraceae bacterium]|nr:hypothetical protein [Lachnospiraceae bacterium]
MSQEDNHNTVRRERVQRLKKIIVTSVFILILIPYILCAVLFVRLHNMNIRIDSLGMQLEQLI